MREPNWKEKTKRLLLPVGRVVLVGQIMTLYSKFHI